MWTPRQFQHVEDEGFEEPRIGTGRSASRWEFAKVVLVARPNPSTLCGIAKHELGLWKETPKAGGAGGAWAIPSRRHRRNLPCRRLTRLSLLGGPSPRQARWHRDEGIEGEEEERKEEEEEAADDEDAADEEGDADDEAADVVEVDVEDADDEGDDDEDAVDEDADVEDADEDGDDGDDENADDGDRCCRLCCCCSRCRRFVAAADSQLRPLRGPSRGGPSSLPRLTLTGLGEAGRLRCLPLLFSLHIALSFVLLSPKSFLLGPCRRRRLLPASAEGRDVATYGSPVGRRRRRGGGLSAAGTRPGRCSAVSLPAASPAAPSPRVRSRAGSRGPRATRTLRSLTDRLREYRRDKWGHDLSLESLGSSFALAVGRLMRVGIHGHPPFAQEPKLLSPKRLVFPAISAASIQGEYAFRHPIRDRTGERPLGPAVPTNIAGSTEELAR